MKRRDVIRCGAACALAGACGKFVDEPVAIEAGAPSRGLLAVPLARIPELSRPGGSVLLHANASDYLGRRVSVLVANTTSQGLRAFGAYCPHAGCEVAWVDGEDSAVCPCHLSKFSVDGTVTHPPAAAGLDTYPAKLSPDGATLLVDVSAAIVSFPPVQNGEVSFTIAQLPQLAAVGGSVTADAPGAPFPLVVLRVSATEVVAFDARCPHLGCAVRGASQLFICPCHGSLFALDGTVKGPPATSGLTRLTSSFDGSRVTVKVGA